MKLEGMLLSAVALALSHSEQIINISGKNPENLLDWSYPSIALMSGLLIVNETAVVGGGEARIKMLAHLVQCKNMQEWQDPFINYPNSSISMLFLTYKNNMKTKCNLLNTHGKIPQSLSVKNSLRRSLSRSIGYLLVLSCIWWAKFRLKVGRCHSSDHNSCVILHQFWIWLSLQKRASWNIFFFSYFLIWSLKPGPFMVSSQLPSPNHFPTIPHKNPTRCSDFDAVKRPLWSPNQMSWQVKAIQLHPALRQKFALEHGFSAWELQPLVRSQTGFRGLQPPSIFRARWEGGSWKIFFLLLYGGHGLEKVENHWIRASLLKSSILTLKLQVMEASLHRNPFPWCCPFVGCPHL